MAVCKCSFRFKINSFSCALPGCIDLLSYRSRSSASQVSNTCRLFNLRRLNLGVFCRYDSDIMIRQKSAFYCTAQELKITRMKNAPHTIEYNVVNFGTKCSRTKRSVYHHEESSALTSPIRVYPLFKLGFWKNSLIRWERLKDCTTYWGRSFVDCFFWWCHIPCLEQWCSKDGL